MNIAVWDTYVRKEDGSLMHFDILVSADLMDKDQVVRYGNEYLASKSQPGGISTTDRCAFCHIEAPTPEVEKLVEKRGFAIIEMENCA